MNPLLISVYVLIFSILFCFFAGLITQNYSHVDRIWSVLPPVYVLIWMHEYLGNPRYIIVAVLIIIWGIRLTTNFAIKGGYLFSFKKGFYGEDYRWEVLRGKISNRFLFEIFNLFFISTFQLVLIFLFTLPVYYLGKYTGPIQSFEIILFVIHGSLLLFESISDIQQLRYYKLRSDDTGKTDKRVQLGFNTFGLWKYCRHPNYFSEIGQWIVVYLYLHMNSGLNPAIAGCSVLILLFAGSTIMTENITLSKYPEYSEWRKITSSWIPFAYLPVRKSQRKIFFDKYHV